MTPEEREVFEQIILDHDRHPKNYGKPPASTHEARGYNPLCGDQYHVFLRLEGDRIMEAGFEGRGCAISKASASIMTTLLKGKTLAQAEHLFAAFHGLLTAEHGDVDEDLLGDLVALVGVRRYPNRVKCANLAWHAMRSALHNEGSTSTE